VPRSETKQYEFYAKIAREKPDLRLDAQLLPEKITPEIMRDINEKPALLAIDMDEIYDPQTDEKTLRGKR
jgi:alpha,alpha-trehalase